MKKVHNAIFTVARGSVLSAYKTQLVSVDLIGEKNQVILE